MINPQLQEIKISSFSYVEDSCRVGKVAGIPIGMRYRPHSDDNLTLRSVPEEICDRKLVNDAIFLRIEPRGLEPGNFLQVVDSLKVAMIHSVLDNGIGLRTCDLQYACDFSGRAFVHIHLTEILREVIVYGLDLLIGGGSAARNHVVDNIGPALLRGSAGCDEVGAMARSADLLDYVLSFTFGEVLSLSEGDQ